MIKRFEEDNRVKLAFVLVTLAISALVGLVVGDMVWGSMTASAIVILLSLLRVKHDPSLWRGR